MATRASDTASRGATPGKGSRHSAGDLGAKAEGVADWVRRAILEGRLKPGERIRQEAVARECRTSRMPVREALSRLEKDGLVSLTSHVGARVATLDLAELDEIYLLREQLEPLALAESIPNLSLGNHQKLRGFMLEMESCADPGDPSRWVEVDRLFHLSSYSEAPLPQLLELIHGFWNRTQQYRRAYTRLSERFTIAHMEHRLLLEAIERQEVDEAAALSRLHIRRTRLALDQEPELVSRKPRP